MCETWHCTYGIRRGNHLVNLVAGFNYDFIGEIGYVAGWGITDRRRHKSGRLKAAEMEVRVVSQCSISEFCFVLYMKVDAMNMNFAADCSRLRDLRLQEAAEPRQDVREVL